MHIFKYFLVGFASVIFQIGNIDAESIFATQDASIKEDDSVNGNWSMNEVYGGSSAIVALVEFDLSGFSTDNNVQTATFSPYVRTLKDDQPSTFSIYSTTPKEWSQSSVQWSTRPLKDQFLDTVTITADESYVEFDVTNAVQAAINNGQSKVTFWIEDSEEDYEGFEFDSVNKNPSYPNEPELVIVSGVAETDTTAPTFSSASTSTDGNKVILSYNESLSSTTASASDFLVEVDGVTAIISGVAISGSTVELTLGSAISSGQSVTVAFTDPTSNNDSNAIQDTSGNDAATLSTTTVSNQVAEVGQGLLQILGSTVNDKDWNENVGGGHLRADLSQLSDRDISEAIEYQWYADDVVVSGATSRDFKLEEHNISTEAIHLVATYTTLSGQQRISTSPTLNQLDWRIFSNGEDPSIAGDYPYAGIMESNLVSDNPAPFMATYSFAPDSRTHGGNGWYEDGYRSSETHSITSLRASDQGLPTQEGTNILKMAATSDSKRVEWGNRNFNTRVQENQNVYVSQKIYLPSSEWDEVTQYSTIIYQHKQYPGSDPNFEIRLSNLGDYKLYVRSPYSHYGLTGQKVTDYPIATLSPDTWHDFKIHLTPSQSNSVGQMTIYLDGEVIFSEQGTNLNDKDTTNDSFLKLGMYTQILDDRHYFVDAVEMATFLPSTVSDWVNGTMYDSTDTTAPSFISAATSADGTKIILTYNEALSSATASVTDFTVKVDDSAATISGVTTSGSNVELTLSSAVAYGQTVNVAYTDPTSGNDSHAIQDAAGNDADTLSTTAVANNVPQISTNNFVQLLGSNNQSTNNDQFDGCLYAEIGNIKDLDTSKAVEYQWYADGVLMPGYTDVAIRGLRWSDTYKNKSIHVEVAYTPIGSSETKTLSSDSMAWGNFYFNYGGEPGNGYQGTSNTDGIRDIIVMPDYQGNNPKALGSYLQYDAGVSEPGNEADRHSIKTVHQDDVGVAAREGEHLIEFSAKEISNRTELGTGDTHHWFYEGEDVYFSYSLYLPKEEWDPVTDISTIITQLRQFGMYDGPNFGLRLSNEGDYKLIIESMLFDGSPYRDIGVTLAPDKWFDIKIHSKQSKGNDGEVNIWIDNQLAWEYDGPTMYYSDDAGYISFGMYTEIRDDRKFYIDAIEQTDHLYRVNSLEEWSQLSPGGNPAAPDTTAPTFSSAATSTDGTKVVLSYNEALSATTASASDFTVKVDGSAATISSVATSGSTVELTLSSAVAYGETVTVAYTDPTSGNDSNAIQDAAGNDASNLGTSAVTNQVQDTSRTIRGPRILGTAEDYSGVRGVLLADIYGVSDLDQTKTTSYQWLANGNAIAGATNQTLDVGDFKSSIENKEITVQLSYTNTSGEETTVTSAVMPYEGFRIVANAEDGRNEWSGTTASEEVAGSVNPYPFVESYSNNGTSNTDGTSAGSAHNITAVKASDAGITAREGDNIIRIYADGSKSNRSELAHLNNETTFKAGEEYYFSGSFFAPKSEWDPVTEGGSTVITQLKQYGGGDPNFELRLSNNGDYKMFWRAVPHDLDAYQSMGSAIPDAWNDLKIYTKHSQGSDGVFRVWLNNEKVIDYSGATMYRSAEGYLKFGMYTEIHDERIIYWDAIDIADHLENDFDTWLSSGNNLPSLSVSGISDNQQFTSSDQLSISGNAIDPAGNQLGTSGGIQAVDLFLGDTKIQSTTESDFSFSNLNLSNGEHKLRLVATDTDGNTAEKNYTIWIGNKPAEISIEASDFFLGSFNTDSDVALTTTAADSDGSIVTVEFLANGQLIGTASKGNGNQYSLNWRPSQAGAYSIQARATDNQGAVTLSDSKAALVGASITGSTLTATQDVTITQNSSSTGNYSNTEIYGSTSAPKIALVEFDLSDIISAKYIQSAVFKPYVTKLQNSPGTFSIYAAGTVDWSQTSADWYDKPSKGKLLDTITISSTNQYVSFDVTEALQDAIDAGQAKITLWIEDSEQEQQRFDFASENNSSINKPAQLIISSSTEALPIPVAGSFKLDGDSGDYNGDTGGETEPVLDPAAAGLYPIDVTGSAGAEIKVPFLVNNFQGISRIRTTITWDESVIQLVMDGDNPKISDSPEIMTGFPFILPNYFSVYSNNALTMVWDESIDPENGRSLDDESVLFALHFTLIGNAGDTGVIRLSDDPTPFKLAPGSGEDIDETTQWAEITLINEFTVSGNVTMVGDASSLPVSGVMVTLNQDGSDNDTLTDVSGDYSFTLTSGSGIELSANLAHGEGKASRGVDVADIVEMRKHILARVRFENARKMVAADTNRDASVDVADIVAMRKVILARTDYFSEDGDGNKEAFWRFVDVDFVGLSADAAFDQVESFEKIGFGSLSSDFSELDFAAIKLGDVNGDWTDPSATTLSGRNAMESARLMRLSAPQATSDGSVSIDLHADGMQGLLGMQFGLNWDGQVLRLEGIETHQLPGFSQQAHSHLQEGNAQVAWDNAMLNDLNLVASEPVMTLHFTLQPGANRGTSIELTQLVLVGSNGSERAALGVASYYHPEGGTMLSSQGLIRSMHRSEGNLSLEFATQEGTSYVVESTEALATGQWKAITTVEGSGRHEVIEMPTTEQAQSYLRVREISGIVK